MKHAILKTLGLAALLSAKLPWPTTSCAVMRQLIQIRRDKRSFAGRKTARRMERPERGRFVT
jgi:hypothetical protein